MNPDSHHPKAFILGNEAIARGALEAGVKFVSGYPGTPSSEIIKTLAASAAEHDMHVQWSVNEMAAINNALGASLAGRRALVTMKHAGFNWIVDPLSVAVLTGIRGGLVIVTADDPNCHSSANEQDNRFYGLFLKILTLEPADAQEALELTRQAFEISETAELPVILRTVTRLSHSRFDVGLKPIVKHRVAPDNAPQLETDPERFYMTGARTMKGRRWHLGQQAVLENLATALPHNKLQYKDSGSRLLVTAGVAYNYVQDALRELKSETTAVLKLAGVYPLSRSLIKTAMDGKQEILVIEEGEPFVEMQLKALAADLAANVRIYGKMSGSLRAAGELNVDIVARAIARFLNLQLHVPATECSDLKAAADNLPPRTMGFCAGCPHTGTMAALKKVLKKKKPKPFIGGDIGCYTLMCYPPHELGDAKFSMGASIGVASGVSQVIDGKTIAVIGDSTFIHAGIPNLINAVYNQSDMLLIICDNATTAMTGAQPHAGSGKTATGQATKMLDLEKMAQACGVDSVTMTDPYDLKQTLRAIKEAMARPGVDVVIARRACALEATRRMLQNGESPEPYSVDSERCVVCATCVRTTGCPAISLAEDTAAIEPAVCTGCSVCAQICPAGAILKL